MEQTLGTNKKLWFKAKRYGWGWQPATWQGWLTFVLYLIVLFEIVSRVDKGSHSGSDTLIGAAVPFIVLTIIFIGICYLKGEKPHWRWGGEDGTSQK